MGRSGGLPSSLCRPCKGPEVGKWWHLLRTKGAPVIGAQCRRGGVERDGTAEEGTSL